MGPSYHYCGGACDNPNVLDKEAGALALKAFIALYEHTQGDEWIAPAAYAHVSASFHKKADEEIHRRPSAVDRVEARQLEMLDRLDDMSQALRGGGGAESAPTIPLESGDALR